MKLLKHAANKSLQHATDECIAVSALAGYTLKFRRKTDMPCTSSYIFVVTVIFFALSSVCYSLPHRRHKRAFVKDYFIDPITIPAVEFEKDANGNYHMKTIPKVKGEVKYAAAEGIDEKIDAVKLKAKEGLEKADNEKAKEKVVKDPTLTLPKDVKSIEVLKDTLDEMSLKEKAESKIPAGIFNLGMDNKNVEATKAEDIPKTFDIKPEEFEIQTMDPLQTDTVPVRPILIPGEKPNGKDDISLNVEPAVEDGYKKVVIGQPPLMHPRIISDDKRIPIPLFVPIRGLSFGSVSFMPLPPPAADISDRLPMADVEADVDESESTLVEEVMPKKAEEKTDVSYPLGNPLILSMKFPFLPIHKMLSEVESIVSKTVLPSVDEDKPLDETKSEIKEIMGKKFLLKTNVMKYPSNGNNRLYVRLMSVQPLDKADPMAADEMMEENDKILVSKKSSEEGSEMLKDKEMEGKTKEEMEIVMKKDSQFLKQEPQLFTKKDENILKNVAAGVEEKHEVLKAEEKVKKEKSDIEMSVLDSPARQMKRVDIMSAESGNGKMTISEIETKGIGKDMEAQYEIKQRETGKNKDEFVHILQTDQSLKAPTAIESKVVKVEVKENEMFPGFLDDKVGNNEETKLKKSESGSTIKMKGDSFVEVMMDESDSSEGPLDRKNVKELVNDKLFVGTSITELNKEKMKEGKMNINEEMKMNGERIKNNDMTLNSEMKMIGEEMKKMLKGETRADSELKMSGEELEMKINEGFKESAKKEMDNSRLEIQKGIFFPSSVEDRLPIEPLILAMSDEERKKWETGEKVIDKSETNKDVFQKNLDEEPSEFIEKRLKPDKEMIVLNKMKDDESEEKDSSGLKQILKDMSQTIIVTEAENEKTKNGMAIPADTNKEKDISSAEGVIYLEEKKKIDKSEVHKLSKNKTLKKKKCKCEDSETDSEED